MNEFVVIALLFCAAIVVFFNIEDSSLILLALIALAIIFLLSGCGGNPDVVNVQGQPTKEYKQ